MKATARLVCLVGVFSVLGSAWAAAAPARNVQLRWDFRKDPPSQLEVWIDCARVSDDQTQCTDADHVIAGVAAYRFELRRSDKVTLVTIAAKAGDPGSAEYAVTGTNLDDKDLDQLKKLVTAAAGGAAAAKGVVTPTGETPPPLPDAFLYPKAVTDPLIGGGKLTVTYNLKKKEGDKETVTKTSGALTFNIHQESPRITVSGGIGFSNAPNPSVALIKTSTIVSFTKDGKPQQAYQQAITLKDTDDTLRPVQSLMTLANFHLFGQIYASAGFRVDQKIFEQPIIGVTYRHPVGARTGLNFTLGTMFSRETEILKDSGFTAGQTIDPTVGLTADDILTGPRTHHRVAFLLTLDF